MNDQPTPTLSFHDPLPEVASEVDLRRIARLCGHCQRKTVVPLTSHQLAQQPDDTTHVCHPAIGGCNHGYAVDHG